VPAAAEPAAAGTAAAARAAPRAAATVAARWVDAKGRRKTALAVVAMEREAGAVPAELTAASGDSLAAWAAWAATAAQ
jgi:hypothetical protein